MHQVVALHVVHHDVQVTVHKRALGVAEFGKCLLFAIGLHEGDAFFDHRHGFIRCSLVAGHGHCREGQRGQTDGDALEYGVHQSHSFSYLR